MSYSGSGVSGSGSGISYFGSCRVLYGIWRVLPGKWLSHSGSLETGTGPQQVHTGRRRSPKKFPKSRISPLNSPKGTRAPVLPLTWASRVATRAKTPETDKQGYRR